MRPPRPPPALVLAPLPLLLLLLLGCAPSAGAQRPARRKYLCPARFVRHGNSCYFLSAHMANWFEAHHACRDRGAELAVLEKGWEDRNMRTYLNKPELARLERWIGGIYNWETKRWLWGANGGNPLKYQGFSQMSKDSEPHWNCIVMDPSMNYKWGSRLCIAEKHYICEVPLKRLQPPQPHATQPRKPSKNRDPNKPKKPRDHPKRPKDPNRRGRDPDRPQRQNRQGRRQRQHLRQQQRAIARQQGTAAPTTPSPSSSPSAPVDRPQSQPLPAHHRTWVGQHKYKYLQLQPDLVPYREEVLI